MSKPARFDVVGHMPALRRYAMALTRNRTDADDLVHDVLVIAYERRAAFQLESNLRLWLFAILYNRFIDDTRTRSVRTSHVVRETLLQDEASPPTQEQGVWLGQVRRAVEQLPEEQRAALHLVAVEGINYAQAAEVLGIPIGTLMSRLARARIALRALNEPLADASRSPTHLKLVKGRDDR